MATSTPEKHPRERTGYRFMIIGFVLILISGIFYYIVTEHRPLGHALFFAGIGVYVVGRVLRTQGRLRRESGEKR